MLKSMLPTETAASTSGSAAKTWPEMAMQALELHRSRAIVAMMLAAILR